MGSARRLEPRWRYRNASASLHTPYGAAPLTPCISHPSAPYVCCAFLRHGYFRSLPQREYVPIFWAEAELGQLQGTELEGKAPADREATQADFEAEVRELG